MRDRRAQKSMTKGRSNERIRSSERRAATSGGEAYASSL